MTWKDFLKDAEREELEQLERAKEDTAGAYRRLRLRLKSRCESRMAARIKAEYPKQE